MATAVHFFQSELEKLLRSPEGPVVKELARKTLKVHGRARENCPVRTGRLRGTIRWRIDVDAKGPVGIVGSDAEYAEYVHEGTRYMRGRPFLKDALEAAQ